MARLTATQHGKMRTLNCIFLPDGPTTLDGYKLGDFAIGGSLNTIKWFTDHGLSRSLTCRTDRTPRDALYALWKDRLMALHPRCCVGDFKWDCVSSLAPSRAIAGVEEDGDWCLDVLDGKPRKTKVLFVYARYEPEEESSEDEYDTAEDFVDGDDLTEEANEHGTSHSRAVSVRSGRQADYASSRSPSPAASSEDDGDEEEDELQIVPRRKGSSIRGIAQRLENLAISPAPESPDGQSITTSQGSNRYRELRRFSNVDPKPTIRKPTHLQKKRVMSIQPVPAARARTNTRVSSAPMPTRVPSPVPTRTFEIRMEGTRQRFTVTAGISYNELCTAIRSHAGWTKVLRMENVAHPEKTEIESISLTNRLTGVEFFCIDNEGFYEIVSSAVGGLNVLVSW